MRILSFIAVPLLAVSCGSDPEPRSEIRPVKVYRVEELGYVDRDFAGMATADDATNLAFKVGGQLISVDVSEGQSVGRGQLLARINPRDIELRVAADRSAYLTAKARAERVERLLEKQAVSRQEYEVARSEYVSAKSVYDNSAGELNDTRLTAPFDGIIEKSYVDNYQRIQSGEPIFRLVNPSTRSVKFTMPESGIPLLERGNAHFGVVFENYRGTEFSARLKQYVQTSSDGSGVPVSLTLDDPRLESGRYAITPGMSCVVSMRIDERRDGLTAVPITAIYAPESGGVYVWVVQGDTVRLRSIVPGEPFGEDMVTVTGGLEGGEEVVSAGVYRLHEGERVRILE